MRAAQTDPEDGAGEHLGGRRNHGRARQAGSARARDRGSGNQPAALATAHADPQGAAAQALRQACLRVPAAGNGAGRGARGIVARQAAGGVLNVSAI